MGVCVLAGSECGTLSEERLFATIGKWAIGHRIWPATVNPEDPRWALAEHRTSNPHWWIDYERLQLAWATLHDKTDLPSLRFPALPAKMNERLGTPVGQRPGHLLIEWQRMYREGRTASQTRDAALAFGDPGRL